MGSAARSVQVAILGGGFSGLGVAIGLLKAGIRDFVILEKASVLGGTWRENTYPGCACDVPSLLYSYSFAPKHDWSRFFAEQPEIQSYLLDVAERFGVLPFVEVDTEVIGAQWVESAQRWALETSQGEFEAQFVVAGLGPLHAPKMPDIPGLAGFEGDVFHTAQWRGDLDMKGRRVAVVGTGSSAIQLVPRIQPEVEHLALFQRTPSWVIPKPDYELSALEQEVFRRAPGVQKAYRGAIYSLLELVQLAQRRPEVMEKVQRLGLEHLAEQVPDPALRARLTPTFALGCKRILLSNTYYPALQAPNVTLSSCALESVEPWGVVGADGVEHRVDTIVFATGFHATDPPHAAWVRGRGGVTLEESWGGSPQAYLGTTVAGFPNLFLLIGPNLGNGHSSAFVLIEAQVKYIVDAIEQMKARGLSSVEVRAQVQDTFNDQVQEALAGTVWNAGGCSSWYLDVTGRNSAIYPWTTLDLRRRLRRFDIERYQVRAQISQGYPGGPRVRVEKIELRGAVVAITGGAHGIGRSTAQAMVDAGAVVAIGDLDVEAAKETARALGARVFAFELDVARRASFEAFVAEVEARLGPIDVLVNNAGVMPSGPFLSEDDDVDAAVMGINHWGTSLGMKIVLPGMIARGRGHVVNVASMAGRIAVAGLASYVASKHATVGLSAAVRQEIEGTGVTVSTVMPGAVRTRLSQGLPLKGIWAIEAEDVAEAIVGSCRTRAAQVPVPRPLGLFPWIEALVPTSVMRGLRRALSADRVMKHNDGRTERAQYEADILTQVRRRDEGSTPKKGRPHESSDRPRHDATQ